MWDVQAAAAAAGVPVKAAAVIWISRQTRRKGGADMGDTTGSMFYAFGAFLLIYIVGASIYQGYLWFKKRKNRRKNEKE